MPPRTRKLLEDVSDAAAFILQQTRGFSASTYENDRLVRQAVERNFEIIGEAINRLRKENPAVASRISDIDQIVAFRNVLIHGYHLIDDAEVWRVIEHSLPVLHHEVQQLLGSGGK
ncbi:MAG TPA: HepT-like ribonuclease domain-containing protein [Tepidisphaeraceae bacterium]|nr:HepT-like ribonuclease domain-containing protein [Tepidisphaeraceae bacterium]